MLVQPEKELISGKEIPWSSDHFLNHFTDEPGAEMVRVSGGQADASDRAT